MRYAVIYTVDTSHFDHPENYAPPWDQMQEKLWQETEGDSSYEVSDRFSSEEQAAQWGWATGQGQHRKWCGDLSEEEFEAFCSGCWLTAQEGDGSALGMFGLHGPLVETRAMVFAGHHDADVDSDAWVTPYCEESELAEWLIENGEHIPASIVDAPGQQYLLKTMKDTRTPWQAVTAVLRRKHF